MLKKKIPEQHGQGNFLENFQKKWSHFEEVSYEIAKFFQGFGHISSFLLLKLSHLANSLIASSGSHLAKSSSD